MAYSRAYSSYQNKKVKLIFDKLYREKGYFEGLYNISSVSKRCSSNQKKRVFNCYTVDSNTPVIVTVIWIDLTDETTVNRIEYSMRKVLESDVLAENVWIEDPDNDDKQISNTNSDIYERYFNLYIAEYTKQYALKQGVNPLKYYISSTWKKYNELINNLDEKLENFKSNKLQQLTQRDLQLFKINTYLLIFKSFNHELFDLTIKIIEKILIFNKEGVPHLNLNSDAVFIDSENEVHFSMINFEYDENDENECDVYNLGKIIYFIFTNTDLPYCISQLYLFEFNLKRQLEKKSTNWSCFINDDYLNGIKNSYVRQLVAKCLDLNPLNRFSLEKLLEFTSLAKNEFDDVDLLSFLKTKDKFSKFCINRLCLLVVDEFKIDTKDRQLNDLRQLSSYSKEINIFSSKSNPIDPSVSSLSSFLNNNYKNGKNDKNERNLITNDAVFKFKEKVKQTKFYHDEYDFSVISENKTINSPFKSTSYQPTQTSQLSQLNLKQNYHQNYQQNQLLVQSDLQHNSKVNSQSVYPQESNSMQKEAVKTSTQEKSSRLKDKLNDLMNTLNIKQSINKKVEKPDIKAIFNFKQTTQTTQTNQINSFDQAKETNTENNFKLAKETREVNFNQNHEIEFDKTNIKTKLDELSILNSHNDISVAYIQEKECNSIKNQNQEKDERVLLLPQNPNTFSFDNFNALKANCMKNYANLTKIKPIQKIEEENNPFTDSLEGGYQNEEKKQILLVNKNTSVRTSDVLDFNRVNLVNMKYSSTNSRENSIQQSPKKEKCNNNSKFDPSTINERIENIIKKKTAPQHQQSDELKKTIEMNKPVEVKKSIELKFEEKEKFEEGCSIGSIAQLNSELDNLTAFLQKMNKNN